MTDTVIAEIAAEELNLAIIWHRAYMIGSGSTFIQTEDEFFFGYNYGRMDVRVLTQTVFDLKRDLTWYSDKERNVWLEGFLSGVIAGKERLNGTVRRAA